MTKKIKSLLVYCGANSGNKPVYAAAARNLGILLAQQKIRLIYGGGSVGLMGEVANAVLNAGGEVTGVIPGFLNVKEIGHKNLTGIHVVNSMHERKALMEKLCDAVVALPGGYGTMDEFFEMLTWAQLGLHRKPLGVLNTNGFYDAFVTQLDKMVEEGFLKKNNRKMVVVNSNEKDLLAQLEKTEIIPEAKWMKSGEE